MVSDTAQNQATHDTSRGGRPAFPTTCWSRILGPGPADRDLEALARAYWRPVYGAVRARGWSHEDAVDATQDFFAWMMQRDLLGRVDPARGRFRAFLKTALANFLIDSHRRDSALKRGGGRAVLRIDHEHDERASLDLVDYAGQTPDALLDQLWRAALVERATDALEQELRGQGRGTYFDVFRDYFLSADDLDYTAVAKRYGITNAHVSNYLQHAKKRYRLLLRAAVQETVSNPEDFEEELTWLFGGSA